MNKFINMLASLDTVTLDEIAFFIERKATEHLKFRGQIARDLRRLGVDAFRKSRSYDILKAKYKAAHAGKKKFAILDLIQKESCAKEEQYDY